MILRLTNKYLILAKTLLFFLSFALLSVVQAQTNPVRARNAVSIGLLGHNQLVGLSYHHLFHIRTRSTLNFRIGLPLYNIANARTIFDKTGKSASLGFGFLYGKNSSFLDLSLNYNIMDDRREIQYKKQYSHFPNLFLGYRWQKPEGGFLFRAGLSPSMFIRPDERPDFFLIPSLDIGFTFPNVHSPYYSKIRKANKEARLHEKTPSSQAVFLSLWTGTGRNRIFLRSNERNGGLGGNTSYYLKFTRNIPNFLGGAEAEWKISSKLGLSAGLAYSYESFAFKYSITSQGYDRNYSVWSTAGKLKYTSSNLGLLLNFHVYPDKKGIFSLLAGPYFVLPLSYQVEGIIDHQKVNREDIQKEHKGLRPSTLRFGLSAGVQARVPLQKNKLLFRIRAGRDLGYYVFSPLAGISWVRAEIGYGIQLF